jgi:hypothetical protein
MNAFVGAIVRGSVEKPAIDKIGTPLPHSRRSARRALPAVNAGNIDRGVDCLRHYPFGGRAKSIALPSRVQHWFWGNNVLEQEATYRAPHCLHLLARHLIAGCHWECQAR